MCLRKSYCEPTWITSARKRWKQSEPGRILTSLHFTTISRAVKRGMPWHSKGFWDYVFAISRLDGGAHRGVFHHALHQPHALVRQSRVTELCLAHIASADREQLRPHRAQSIIGAPQDHEEIFLGYGPVRRVDQGPPSPD